MSEFIVGQSVIVLRATGPKVYTIEDISKTNNSMTLTRMGNPKAAARASGKNVYNKQEVFHLTEENCRAINTLYNTDIRTEEEFEVVVTMTLKKTIRVTATDRNSACLKAEDMSLNGKLDLCTQEDFSDIRYD